MTVLGGHAGSTDLPPKTLIADMEAGTDDPVENPRKRAAYLKRLAADMRKQLKAERAGGSPTLAGLQAALEQAEDDIERLEAETEKAKRQSKKRKR